MIAIKKDNHSSLEVDLNQIKEDVKKGELVLEHVMFLKLIKEVGFNEVYEGYEKLLDIMKDNEENNICRLSKKKISELYGMSYTSTLNKMNFLVRYDLIRQVDGGFVRTEEELINATPFFIMPKMLALKILRPDLRIRERKNYQKQAEILSVSLKEIQVADGFITYVISHPECSLYQ
ncbi:MULTISPECIES: hypothetical protein [Peribacillus]|uniref:hypothetical protein n=1 Tax=Peribacillus TaxID=2675229 RepID=UPI000BA714D7|nr:MULTISPECIES: hypothetical protein [Peribacillus]MCM3170395.1 hypothetical protein [Peribacillus frigoritolerans]PAL04667.1 hypothetical protein B8W99_26515 [Peribacillus simplex]